ncbi:unnamed protein product [Polarella glacialis]|uniref:Uncharacterized protein n=1 Tax=Polarella glacialis TaxID=89957 RepID=A0A813GXA6_POLGL|nr:unnamed protein product [Polarella glacialis]
MQAPAIDAKVAAAAVGRCLDGLRPRVRRVELTSELGLSEEEASAALLEAASVGPGEAGVPCRSVDWLVVSSLPGARELRITTSAEAEAAAASGSTSVHAEVHSIRPSAVGHADCATLSWRSELEACWEAYRTRPPGPNGPAPPPAQLAPAPSSDLGVVDLSDDDDECHVIGVS